MMFPTSLLTVTLLLCAVGVSTTPVIVRHSPIRLPLTRRLNVTSVHNLLRHDQARAKTLRTRANLRLFPPIVGGEPVDNQAVSYVAAIGVGTPPTTCEHRSLNVCWWLPNCYI